ncbi:xanthine dehydrogenase small subunit [Hyphococcus sp.]|uniref:xanthine dehydrogenase small subunit n=1 Tax=Hyphococcus sp. TaxID=2038636 RepID=UPI002089A480|nr:MAG: xanthine dehydrogenase small subunit [Marinicaulis sp.]
MKMRNSISFYLNGELRTLQNVAPTQTLLRYLRDEEKLCGTKEGCAEGDCGACTVMISRLDSEGYTKREAINACIRFMPSLDGVSVTTVEALSENASAPHPVQQSMIDNHGSQCGFCTPGFIMSLFTAYRNRAALPLAAANDLLAGNLCRCTGYGPILKAAKEIGAVAASIDQSGDDHNESAQLGLLKHDDPIEIAHASGRAYLPANSDQLAELYSDNPSATIVSGATDVGLWVTKQHRKLPVVIFVNRVKDLARIESRPNELVIGAGVTYSDALVVLAATYPDLGELVRRIGAVQVRNAGTIGGNIANGSPIGDMPPALIALGASLVLRQGGKQRALPLEDFFLGYGRQDRRPGEFVVGLRIPISEQTAGVKCYKISKRFDQDISALCGCFNIEIKSGVVDSARVAFGGMAEIPKRASAVEAVLVGKPWVRGTVETAKAAFATDFTPISDMRASADYRLRAAQNLLLKYFLETENAFSESRIVGHGSVFA